MTYREKRVNIRAKDFEIGNSGCQGLNFTVGAKIRIHKNVQEIRGYDNGRKLLMDVVGSLYEDGFRKIVLMCTHGGNWIVKPTVIELNRKYPDLKLIYAGGDLLSYRGQARVSDLHSGTGRLS